MSYDIPAPLGVYNNNRDDYARAADCEYVQCLEEGLDVERAKELFKAVRSMSPGQARDRAADALFALVSSAPMREDYAYDEPEEPERIRERCEPFELAAGVPDERALEDKVAGAWYGRIAGCLLGKPVEGIKTYELIPLLKETGNYPLRRYMLSSDISDKIAAGYRFPLKGRCWADTVKRAPVDDDTNYTVLCQILIDEYGRDFKSDDIARIWLDKQPMSAYFTAEKTAFANFILGYAPPYSAIYKNPYREFIGAQIRADYFGYINPGDPVAAAQAAWRDARVSHVKNGVYGEMFVAAALACAACTDNAADVIRGGMAQIPASSRLWARLSSVLGDYCRGAGVDDVFDSIRDDYDENTGYGRCHVIPNAAVVAAALLYGEGDYSKTVGLAVQAGFDTDCNGATAGSIFGMMHGIGSIGGEWLAPLGGRLDTSIVGVGTVDIDDLIKKTMKHIKEI